MQGLLFVYSRFSPPTTLKKAPEEIGSEVIERIFTIELMLNANVVSYPLSSCPICCFSQGGDSSEARSVATATIEVMGLYWSCDWFATFSTLRVQGVFFWWGFCWRWFCREFGDELGGIFVPSIWINLEMIISIFHWYYPTRIGGGTYRYPNDWMLFSMLFNLSGFSPMTLHRWLVGIYIPTVPSHIRFGMQMLALG